MDSVCCGSSACGKGETCAATGKEGVCIHKNGEACAVDAECASGFCTDGACCDTRCDGQCAACDVAGAVGKCTGILGTPHGTRKACDDGGGDACKAKRCDGVDPASCAGFAPTDVVCRAASCAEGKAVAAASCDGKGACPAPVSTSCGGFLCNGTACGTSCTATKDCGKAYECIASKCQPATAKCTSDNLGVSIGDGTIKRCYPYVCVAGECVTQCSTSAHCAGGFVCDGASKTCVPPEATSGGDEGGCSTSGSRGNDATLALATIVALAFVRRRKR